MEMSSNETIKQAVMAGMAVTFLSLHTVRLESQDGAAAVARWPVHAGNWQRRGFATS